MKTYEITLDVMTTMTTTIEAESEAQAIKMAEREAYEDTWGNKAIYSHTEFVDAELLEEAK
jgi:hypothetical protein